MIAKKIINKSEKIFNDKHNSLSKSSKPYQSMSVIKNDIELLEKDCKNFLNGSNKTLEQLIDTFNNLIIEVTKIIMSQLPSNDDIKNANDKINKIIFINKVEPISMFIKNIYADNDYRISLKNGEEDFFMNASPKDIIDKHKSNNILSNENSIRKFFEFKNYWKRLDETTQLTIKAIMSTLIDITEKYIEIKDDSNDIAKILLKIDKLD